MNFQFYVEKLHASENFKKFKQENPDVFLCSGFFVIDKEGKDNKQHFDFYIPSKKEVFSFQLEDGKLVPLEMFGSVTEEISMNCDFNFEDIEKMIVNEMEKRNMKSKIQKLMFSLQSKDKKDFLITTVFISGFGMLNIQIDISEKKIISFEKKSFFDLVRRVK